jgi:hypothetical protein
MLISWERRGQSIVCLGAFDDRVAIRELGQRRVSKTL